MRIGWLLLAFAFLCSIPVIAKTKTRDWKTGTLLDVKTDSQTAVSGVFNPKTGGTVSSGVIMLVRYEIDSGDMVYVVRQGLRRRWDKPAQVTVNTQVKFAIDNLDVYLVDETGKEFKFALEKKTLKVPPKTP